MENLITRNTKFESLEELVQFVENHKGAGIAVVGIMSLSYVFDKNLKVFLHDLNKTIAENGCELGGKLIQITIPPKNAYNNV